MGAGSLISQFNATAAVIRTQQVGALTVEKGVQFGVLSQSSVTEASNGLSTYHAHSAPITSAPIATTNALKNQRR